MFLLIKNWMYNIRYRVAIITGLSLYLLEWPNATSINWRISVYLVELRVWQLFVLSEYKRLHFELRIMPQLHGVCQILSECLCCLVACAHQRTSVCQYKTGKQLVSCDLAFSIHFWKLLVWLTKSQIITGDRRLTHFEFQHLLSTHLVIPVKCTNWSHRVQGQLNSSLGLPFHSMDSSWTGTVVVNNTKTYFQWNSLLWDELDNYIAHERASLMNAKPITNCRAHTNKIEF